MVTIEKFVFNPFQENTYILSDETNKCVIVDPGCYGSQEELFLQDYINKKGLKPVKQMYTHCHVDHILGNNYVHKTWGLKPEIHKEGLAFLESGHQQGKMYGFEMEPNILPEKFIEHGDTVKFGNSELKVVYTPGHADGSICFIAYPEKFVITGDVLFRDSIGRTDFPTGDFDVLMKSIHEHLFTLEDDFTVYCGHGPETTIGYEKVNNPFIRF
ncbi:MAG: MBL fold metallo-hydrolase [Bacteroidales bacterium]|nr:MBL fold metallo-hydrolase [Bacteroidales bacterium]MCF8403756.1 MBL fold metallo-hydrolase [Bacteroidales bacterium]